MEKTLDTEVRSLLEGKRGQWQQIADDSGVSHSWLSKFVNGHIPKPGYVTLQRVHAALMKHQRKAARA